MTNCGSKIQDHWRKCVTKRLVNDKIGILKECLFILSFHFGFINFII